MTRRDRTIRGTTGFLLGLIASTAFAQTPPAPPPAAPAPARAKPVAPDPAFEAARTAFEALPDAERRGLQDALVWTGDYNSVVNGTFGRRSYEALQAYAKRSGGSGLPDAAGRAALLRDGAAARAAARFTVKPDPASGVVLGVPERVLPKRSAQPGGTRWQSIDGRITLETKSYPAGETGLEAVFARITAPNPDRRVTYKLLRPDFLVVTAETATGKSYIRYAAGEAGLRGLILGYDKALAGEVDRLAIAIANSFVPFPDAAPAAAGAASVATPVPTPTPPLLPGTRPAPLATGLLVSPGRVLTSAAALSGCRVPLVAGQTARLGASATADLVVLETGVLAGRTPITPLVRGRSLTEGEAVVALVIDGEGGVAVASGQARMDEAATGDAVGRTRITAPLQTGAGGAPILDRAGAIVGLVPTVPAQPRRVAGVVPPARYGLVTGPALTAFLTATGIRASAPREAGAPGPSSQEDGTLGAAAAALAGAVVPITCQP